MTENIALIGLSISLFTLVNIVNRAKKSQADWLLCLWLLQIVTPMLQIMNVDMTIAGYNLWNLFNPTFNLLHGPLFYFYVRLLTQVNTAFSRRDWLHLAPFALLYALSMTTDLSQQMVPGGSPLGSETVIYSSNSFIAAIESLLLHFAKLNVLSFLFYSALVVYLLIQHQQKVTRYFSRNDTQISLTWIYSLPATLFIITLLNLLNESSLNASTMVDPLILHALCHCTLAILLCFFGIRQKPVFAMDPEPQQTMVEPPAETKIDVVSVAVAGNDQVELSTQHEVNKPLLEQQELEAYKAQINSYMLSEKTFLDTDFSVYALAEAMNIPRRTLSFILSSGFEKNFYQFVNSYRLQEMKTRLTNQNNKDTILDIAFACGFSSKSTYNSLFKKECGCTPTQFRHLAKQLPAQ